MSFNIQIILITQLRRTLLDLHRPRSASSGTMIELASFQSAFNTVARHWLRPKSFASDSLKQVALPVLQSQIRTELDSVAQSDLDGERVYVVIRGFEVGVMNKCVIYSSIRILNSLPAYPFSLPFST